MEKDILIYRGSTPTIRLYVDGLELVDITDISVSIKNGSLYLCKRLQDVLVGAEKIEFQLTQAETLQLDSSRPLIIQLRLEKSGKVLATNQRYIRVANSIGSEVLGNG